MIEKIQVVKSTDVTSTLLSIPIGKTVHCPNGVISSAVIRSTASRLNSQNKGAFSCETFEDGLLITRK